MKVLVHGESLRSRPGRMAPALAGIAARGHDVRWLGGAAPAAAGVTPLASLRVPGDWRPDVVVGAGGAARVAWPGLRAHAGAMVLALAADDLARASIADALAWHALPSFGLVEESDADTVRRAPRHVALERVALWSGAAPASEADATHADAELLERACERVVAIRAGRHGRPAVFVDRDGTLIEEEGYLSDPGRVRLLPGVARALWRLRAAGIPVVVISNQAGVGRGRFPLERAYATMAALRRLLRAEGVELDAIRFCPHAPGDDCPCRKPRTGLVVEVAEDLRLSPAASAMIGDKLLDAWTGQAMGGTGVLVRTGYGRDEELRAAAAPGLTMPDRVFDDLGAAADWILERYEAL